MTILSPLRTTAYSPSMKIVPRLILPEVDEKGHITVHHTFAETTLCTIKYSS